MKQKKIVYIQYTNPACYPPLQHSSWIFAKAGWKVLFLGNGSMSESNAFEFPFHENIQVIRWMYKKPGIVQKFHFLFFCIWSALYACWWGGKWAYCSDPYSCLPAIICQKIFGLKIVYHEHDSPTLNSKSTALFNRILLKCRAIIGRQAEIVVFPNRERANIFQTETGRRRPIEIVRNVPALSEVALIPSTKSENEILFYHGSLNKYRLPTTILDALVHLDPAITLRFAGYDTTSNKYLEWFMKEAKVRGLENRVRYVGGFFSRQNLLIECSKATIGLALMPIDLDDINMRYMTGASNKPFDYLACGLTLIVSNLPDWEIFFVDRGIALSCNPDCGKSIAEAVNKAIVLRAKSNIYSENGEKLLCSEWNYEYQFRNVYDIVTKSCC